MTAELAPKMEEAVPAPKPQGVVLEKKLSMVVFSGDLDKLLAAMIIATGAAAMGTKVVMFFTFWGTAALRDAKKNVGGKDFMSKMFGWMLPKGRNALKLSQMHMGGMGTAMLKNLMKKKNAPSLDQLFEIAAQLGVSINVCQMSMDLMASAKRSSSTTPTWNSWAWPLSWPTPARAPTSFSSNNGNFLA